MKKNISILSRQTPAPALAAALEAVQKSLDQVRAECHRATDIPTRGPSWARAITKTVRNGSVIRFTVLHGSAGTLGADFELIDPMTGKALDLRIQTGDGT